MTARWQSSYPDSLSLLLLLLILFLWFRLRTLRLPARVLRFLLHWLVRLGSRFLLRTGLLLIDTLWSAIFLILHFVLLIGQVFIAVECSIRTLAAWALGRCEAL